jgi:hypothetical protein
MHRVVTKLAALAVLTALASVGPASAAEVEVFAVTPAFSPYDAPGRTVTVKGIGFTGSTTVTIDGVAAAATLVDGRTLVVTVPTVASARVASVVVDDPANGSDEFHPFLYTDPVIYVSTTGDDGDPGTDPNLPKLTITDAFTELDGVTPTEVRIEAGLYLERELAIPIAAVVSCGWAPGFGLRDPDRNVTEIDGEGLSWVFRTYGWENVSVLDGCTVQNGFRDGFGGGALVISSDSPVINNNVIAGSFSSAIGGGAYFIATTWVGGHPTFSNNVIIGNRASNKQGGGIVLYANYNSQSDVRVSLSGNQIVGNRSVNSRGGGVALMTGSYVGNNTGTLKIAENLFGYNRAKVGGGLAVTLLGYSDLFDITFDSNLAIGNTVPGSGGGVSIEGVGTVEGKVVSSTIAQNVAAPTLGGGLMLGAGLTYLPGFMASDMILWGNVGGDAAGLAPSLLTYSDAGTLYPGAGNISADPGFTAGAFGEFYLTQADPNLPVSPAVDAGSASAAELSVEGLTTRIDHVGDAGTADIGFHYSTSVAPPGAPIALTRVDPSTGDLNGNDWVLVRGDGFDPDVAVTFDGVPATNVVYLSETRVLAQPAPHAEGLVDVRVTNPDVSFAELTNRYRYVDNEAPEWTLTVGVVSAESAIDACDRNVILDWNSAVDATSPPIVYEIHRVECIESIYPTTPCDNLGYIPNATTLAGTTPHLTYVDEYPGTLNQNIKWIYNVRARDSASFRTNQEYNFAKRVVESIKSSSAVPPDPVEETLGWAEGSREQLLWTVARGAVAYGVYRETDASGYADPGLLVKFATLDKTNNDGNGDGVTDTEFLDTEMPSPGVIFYYKISSLDSCGTESEL